MHGLPARLQSDENILIGPFEIATRADLPTVHREIEREIWFGLGARKVQPLEVDFETSLSKYLKV
jgi:hypothetical protein